MVVLVCHRGIRNLAVRHVRVTRPDTTSLRFPRPQTLLSCSGVAKKLARCDAIRYRSGQNLGVKPGRIRSNPSSGCGVIGGGRPMAFVWSPLPARVTKENPEMTPRPCFVQAPVT